MSVKGSYGDPNLVYKLGTYRMPFGKHEKTRLIDLPLTYLDWFAQKGFPLGELGQLMRIVHETKSGEMAHFLDDIRKKYPEQSPELTGKK